MINPRYAALICFYVCMPGVLKAEEREVDIQILQPGVKLSMVAEHPLLATPTGIDVDEQGRIWVVATHTHFPPTDYVGPKQDEILVFTESREAGQPPQRQVFYNSTVATMDLELGKEGWVYLAERGRILRIKDTDGDMVADVEEVIINLDSEADYPHNGLEGLAWHPSGDLVFGLGENFAKPWTLTGTDKSSVIGASKGGIFRCSPDGKNLRRIAYGFWNPFGICVRSDGEIFAAENDPGERPPCRVLHIIEGGDYGYERSYGREAHHPFIAWNGELAGTLPMIHPSGEAPCGILPLGRGLLVPSWADHKIDFLPLQPKGASYTSEPVTLLQGSRYFRPSCIASVPGGEGGTGQKRTWYFADWVDGRYESHGYGRVWKLEIDLDQADWTGPLDLEPVTPEAELASQLRSGHHQEDLKSLLKLAGSDDPFLARSALIALAPLTSKWTLNEVLSWSAEDRKQAVIALKLSKTDPGEWGREFLQDENSDVQFETLRWITTAEAKDFKMDVEQYMNRSDLSYRLFEAAIATFNILDGNGEAGIRNPELMLARVNDADSDPRIRAFALRLLPVQSQSPPKDGNTARQNFPKGLTLALLKEMLEVDDETLSLEVVRTLSANAAVSHEILSDIAAAPQRSQTIRVEAITGLATVAEQYLDLLLSLSTSDEKVIREEALRSLRAVQLSPEQIAILKEAATKHPESADFIQSVLSPKVLEQGRPKFTETQAWLDLLDSIEAPVDVDNGRRLFHHAKSAQCSNCHRHDGRGNVVGPDLSSVSQRKDRKWLLQSLLEPSRQMAPEYQPRIIVLKDGRTFTGIRLRSYTKEAIRDSNGQNRVFDRDEVEAMVDSDVSFMPSGIANTLTIRELRDLIAFLEAEIDQK